MCFFNIFFLSVFPSCQSGPVVNTPLGSILGTVQTSRSGSEFYSFRGIRYAEPPIGDLRFKSPVPVSAWDGILNATQNGPACYQPNLPDLSEDCLHLNIYTHRVSSQAENHNVLSHLSGCSLCLSYDEQVSTWQIDVNNSRPVLFYIHEGAFDILSGQSTVHDPIYMMDYDIVVVTINYRLGTLGFFSTGDIYAPGNYGMKDQVLALKWIRGNIRFFGGDPNRVTIAGQSAGGASVGLHLVSPMSRGLFHSALIMSGSPINPRTINKNPIRLARKQAGLLNCPTNTSKDMVDCVGKIPAKHIIDIYGGLKEWNNFGQKNSPVVETENFEGERFLEKDPLDSLLEGDFANVPVFIGTTKDEYISNAISVVKNKSAVADLSENWNEIAPKIFFYERNDTISGILRKVYLEMLGKSHSTDDDIANGLGDLFSDSYVIFTTIRTTKLLARKNKKPVYLYQFNYLGDGLQICFGDEIPNKVEHVHDLLYVFYSSLLCPVEFNTTDSDGIFVTKYTTLWYNFIVTGNPTPEASGDLDNVVWEPYTNSDPKYLDINQTFVLQNGLYYNERISLWESLFPLKN